MKKVKPPPHSVLCAECNHPNVDRGMRQTCYFCGCMPLPSYSYPLKSAFHPKTCHCEVATKKEKMSTMRQRKTTPKLKLKCLLLWLAPLTCQAQFTNPDLYDIPIPVYNTPYHLMFVTEGTIDATSPDINVYNDFVQAEAERIDVVEGALPERSLAADWGLDWYALVSTPDVHARENVQTQGIVYSVLGRHVSVFGNGYSSLWRGHLVGPNCCAMDLTQYYTYEDTRVWTGSTDGGLRTLTMGSPTGQTYTGLTHPHSPEEWISGWQGNRPSTLEYPLYAVSGPIINGEPVEFLDGDYNANGVVEQGDLDLVLTNWVTTSANFHSGFWYYPPLWTYKPPIGQIGQEHLDEVLLNWGNARFTPPQPFGIPEPNTLEILLLLAMAGIIGWYVSDHKSDLL